MAGKAQLEILDTVHILEMGDTASFPGRLPHTYRNAATRGGRPHRSICASRLIQGRTARGTGSVISQRIDHPIRGHMY
ncbi:hypothetical protein BH20CHL5_BH20CHL5_00960 [soil metagenome]